MNILIFSLGEKGSSVVKALFQRTAGHYFGCVIGQDNAVEEDCSSDLTKFCEINGIKYYSRNESLFNDCEYDLFLAVGWRWIIRELPKEKLIVFHDSLLPKYRGFSPLVNALINKEKVIGVTALLGAEDYDTGNIILQDRVDIEYPTEIGAEIKRISRVYANLAIELVSKYNDGTINWSGYPQDESKASYSLWLDEEDYRINWNDDSKDIEHFISCVGYPYRGAATLLNGEKVRITKGLPRPDVKIENRSPGKIIFMEFGCPVVVCGTGLIILKEISDENGKSMLPLKVFRSRFS